MAPRRSDSGNPDQAKPRTPAPDAPEPQQPPRDDNLLPHVALPKGGGAIRGICEKFSVNLVTGTSAISIPLPLSPGRSGVTPKIST